MIKLFSQVLSELGLIILYPILSVTLQLSSKTPVPDPNKKTIVIVERWLSLNIRHLYWRRYLEKHGYNVYLINFPLWSKDFEESSRRLSKYFDANKVNNATLVGISCGAITCLLYLQELGGWKRVENFISIGAPFKGTWMMLLLSFISSGRELLPGSKLVRKISNFKLKNRDKIFCFRAKFDEMVPNGSVLVGTKEIVINTFGHNNMHLEHKKTYKQIIAISTNIAF